MKIICAECGGHIFRCTERFILFGEKDPKGNIICSYGNKDIVESGVIQCDHCGITGKYKMIPDICFEVDIADKD